MMIAVSAFRWRWHAFGCQPDLSTPPSASVRSSVKERLVSGAWKPHAKLHESGRRSAITATKARDESRRKPERQHHHRRWAYLSRAQLSQPVSVAEAAALNAFPRVHPVRSAKGSNAARRLLVSRDDPCPRMDAKSDHRLHHQIE